jgi:hypothetical protein
MFRKISNFRVFAPSSAIFLVFMAVFSVQGQKLVDKTVARVSDGVRTEVITYSDLMWQLALQPGVPLDQPRSEDLNQALQTLINQRVFALEAERVPRKPPSDPEIADEIRDLLTHFPSTAAFETRLKQVGFDSIKDENFEDLIKQRLAIQKYIDFRFGSFVVIIPDEEARYYRDVFVPDFRKRSHGLLMPTLDEQRAEIRRILTRQKVTASIERYLDEAKRRVEVVVLSEV